MAFNKPLQAFQNVAANATATLRIPPEPLTLVGIAFELAGTTFTTANISSVRVKIGPKTAIDLTGAQLLAVNAYKGEAISSTARFYLDLTEQDQAIFPQKEVGGYDLMSLLPFGEVTVEVAIGAATAPQLTAFGVFTPRQNNPMILKMLPFSFPATVAGRNTLPLNLRGALIKRLFAGYAGTDWTASANGNLTRLEVKRNGLVIHDMGCLTWRSLQSRARPARSPQGRYYVYDPCLDDNPAGYLTTVDEVQRGVFIPAPIEVNAYTTAADTVTVVAEVLDLPGNL
jgi:hypothetical protein